MNVAIIDDEPPAIELLTAYIQRTKFLVLQSAFTDPMDAIEQYNWPGPPLLTFLDINLPGINGIDLAKIIQGKTQIILTTSFRNYGPEAYALSVVDYLLKPFSFERFLEAVQKVESTRSDAGMTNDIFFVRTETRGKYSRITIPTIILVESDDNLVHITTHDGTTTAIHKLSDIQSWLPPQQFLRVHRSYIVNLAKVQSIDHGQVVMSNGRAITIGRQYKEQFMNGLQHLTIKNRP